MAGGTESDRLDDALVSRAVAGEHEAFRELLVRHEARVLRVLRLLGVASQDREDVAQDVFVRAFRHLGRYQRGRSFAGWLYRITVNAAHDQRLRHARLSVEQPWNSASEEAPDLRPDPQVVLEREEGRQRFEAALEGLSERERAVFVLCEVEGLDTAGAARALGITRITVRRHLGRARAHLSELLGGR